MEFTDKELQVVEFCMEFTIKKLAKYSKDYFRSRDWEDIEKLIEKIHSYQKKNPCEKHYLW